MILERANRNALHMLVDAGRNELCGKGLDAEYALGLGYCVGRGWATYRGDWHFRITPAGRAVYENNKHADADFGFGSLGGAH
jgi:hypothetical protein